MFVCKFFIIDVDGDNTYNKMRHNQEKTKKIRESQTSLGMRLVHCPEWDDK